MPETTQQPADPNESTTTKQTSPHDAFGTRQSDHDVAGKAPPHPSKAREGVNPSAPEDANTTPGSMPKK